MPNKESVDTILAVCGIVGFVGSFIWWILGRVLDERKDKWQLSSRVDLIAGEVKANTDDIKELQEKQDRDHEEILKLKGNK